MDGDSDDDASFGGFGVTSEITAEMVDTGRVDLQGINWSRNAISREAFRTSRIQNFQTYSNLQLPSDSILSELTFPRSDARFFRFCYTNLRYKCSYMHFQLRHLVWATSRNDVYYSKGTDIMHWCTLTRKNTVAMSLPTVNISTMATGHHFLFAGGYKGEYIYRRLDSEDTGDIRRGFLTTDPNGITNHAEVAFARSGAMSSITSSNDAYARIMDLSRSEITRQFALPWPVNCASLHPNRTLLCIVGDDRDTRILNADNGDVEIVLTGHNDYSFAVAWSPSGNLLATGNQDLTTRIYDIRNPSRTLVVLPANMGSIRSLRFSPDGSYLAAAEPADFVHIYDTKDPLWSNSQIIDFFGEISGMSFLGSEGLVVGNSDDRYGGLLEFGRVKHFGGMRPVEDVAF